MVRSGLFIPTAAWIIPFNGQGMDFKRMNALFKCMIDPVNCTKEEVCQVFMKKRQYVKGRYFNDDGLVQEENEPFIDAGAHQSTVLKVSTPPFTLVKVERDFRPRNRRLGNSLFP